MKDTDLMPFGRYKGYKMIDVPASYLFWLQGQIKEKKPSSRTLTEKQLLEYISDNEDVLTKEITTG